MYHIILYYIISNYINICIIYIDMISWGIEDSPPKVTNIREAGEKERPVISADIAFHLQPQPIYTWLIYGQ
jgi:hypothetical protein